MFVGKDFPSLFDADNFTMRRTTGHNMHDPESLISGAEIAKGLTYTNSKRLWLSETHYLAAVTGLITPVTSMTNHLSVNFLIIGMKDSGTKFLL